MIYFRLVGWMAYFLVTLKEVSEWGMMFTLGLLMAIAAFGGIAILLLGDTNGKQGM
jgi:hypothetical protein